jgi:hypothetical protein
MALTDWTALLMAAGFDVAKLSTSQLYEISGALVNDEEVTQRKRQVAAEHRGRLPQGTTQRILLNMTDDERAAVRSRALSSVRSFANKSLGATTRAESR